MVLPGRPDERDARHRAGVRPGCASTAGRSRSTSSPARAERVPRTACERLGEVIGDDARAARERPRRPGLRARGGEPGVARRCSTATIDDEIELVFLHLPDDEAVAPIAGRGDGVRELLHGLARRLRRGSSSASTATSTSGRCFGPSATGS